MHYIIVAIVVIALALIPVVGPAHAADFPEPANWRLENTWSPNLLVHVSVPSEATNSTLTGVSATALGKPTMNAAKRANRLPPRSTLARPRTEATWSKSCKFLIAPGNSFQAVPSSRA